MKKKAKYLYLLILIFSIIFLPSCKKGKKELPTTEGYIKLPKEKRDEINENFKKVIHNLPIHESTIGEEYNEFTDTFECAAIYDDYYYFADTGRNYTNDTAIPELYYHEEYIIGDTCICSYTMIVIYHNNKFSHNMGELIDLGILDNEKLVKILETANPGRDYSYINDIEFKNVKEHSIIDFKEVEIDSEMEQIINKTFYDKYIGSNIFNLDSPNYFINNYYCIGLIDGYYYFVEKNDVLSNSMIDPILYEKNGIRMQSLGLIWAYKDEVIFEPNYNYIGKYEYKMPVSIYKKNQCLFSAPNYYIFENMNDNDVFKQLSENILSIRIKNGSWPNNKGFVGLD